MTSLTSDVTFTPLSGNRVRCNACRTEKGRTVVLKRKQTPAHRGTHQPKFAELSSVTVQHRVPRVSPRRVEQRRSKVLSIPRAEPQTGPQVLVLAEEQGTSGGACVKCGATPKLGDRICRTCGEWLINPG